MNRSLIILAVFAAAVSGAYFFGRSAGKAACEAAVAAEKLAARDDADKREAVRLKLQAERDRQAKEMEDLAYAQPVASADCMPVSRLRRLNAIR